MKYQMRVVIEDPNVKPGMVAELLFDLDCEFHHNPNQYGNGYCLSISGKDFYKQIIDLRYDTSFDRNHPDIWLYTWAHNYWSGKNGAWKIKSLTISNDETLN